MISILKHLACRQSAIKLARSASQWSVKYRPHLTAQHVDVDQHKRSVERKMRKVMTSMETKGRITRNEVSDIVGEFKALLAMWSSSATLSGPQTLFLINCCGASLSEESPPKRQRLTSEVLAMLSQSAAPLDVSHYNALLQVYLDNDHSFEPLSVLSEMRAKRVSPNWVTYQRLLHRYCHCADMNGANRLLESMRENGVTVNEIAFNSLVFGYAKAREFESSRETIERMKESGVQPSADTYAALLCGYATHATNGETVQLMADTIKEANSAELEMSDKHLLSIIRCLASVDQKCWLIDELIENMPKPHGYNQECAKTISALIHERRLEVMLKLYYSMNRSATQMREKTAGCLIIQQLELHNVEPEFVMQFCEQLREKGFNDIGLSRAAGLALVYGHIDSFHVYLRRMRDQNCPIRPHYFWPLLAKCQTESQILSVLENMASQSLTGFEFSALNDTFVEFVWPKSISDTEEFIQKCKSIGFSYTITFNSLVYHCIRKGEMGEACELLCAQKYASVKLYLPKSICELLAEAYVENASLEPIVRILVELNQCSSRLMDDTQPNRDLFGEFILHLISLRINDCNSLIGPVLKALTERDVKVSTKHANDIRVKAILSAENYSLLETLTLSTHSTPSSQYDLNSLTKARQEMNCEQLEQHLLELSANGLNTNGVLQDLLSAYCKRARYLDVRTVDDQSESCLKARVSQIAEQLAESGVTFNNSMYAMLLDFYVNVNTVDEALNAQKQISSEYPLEAYRVFNLARLCAQNGRINKALEVMREEREKMLRTQTKSEENRICDKAINKLLYTVAEVTKDPRLVRKFFETCANYSPEWSTTDAERLTCGALVKVNMINGDLETALAVFVNCVRNYGSTPWKSELMRAFLENGDTNRLQAVIDASNSLRGETNTVLDVAIVCVECGFEKQAKKLLDAPGLRVKQSRLEMICGSFAERDKIDELEMFIRVTRNLCDINRDKLYEKLVMACAKQDSVERALNAWTSIQEENLTPSDKTLRLLGQFLHRNGIAVPFKYSPRVSSNIRNANS